MYNSPSGAKWSLASANPTVYDGFEFKERATKDLYVSLKRRMSVATTISIMAIVPGFALLLQSYLSPSGSPQYLYLVFLAISLPFSVLSFRTNSRLTELINSNDVRHVGF